MTKKSTEFLRSYLNVLEAQLDYAKTGREMRISSRLVFVWIADSKRAQSAGDVDSVFFFKLDPEDEDEQPRWFHDFCRDVVGVSIEEIESGARQRARDGVYQVSKFQGRSVIKLNPDLEQLGFEGPDAYLLDENGKPVYEMVWTPPTNELVLGVLAAYSKRYKKQTQGGTNVSVNVGGGVQIVGENRPQIAAAQPLAQVQIVERQSELPPADFTEVNEADLLAEMLGEAPDQPDDEKELSPDGVAVVDAAAIASVGPRPIPAGMRADFDRLVARGAISPDGRTIGTTVAPVVISTATPENYKSEPDPLIRPTNGKPLSDTERALLSRLPGSLNRKA